MSGAGDLLKNYRVRRVEYHGEPDAYYVERAGEDVTGTRILGEIDPPEWYRVACFASLWRAKKWIARDIAGTVKKEEVVWP